MRFHSIASFILRRAPGCDPGSGSCGLPGPVPVSGAGAADPEADLHLQDLISGPVSFFLGDQRPDRDPERFYFQFPVPGALLFSFHGGRPDDLLPHGSHGFGDAFELFSCDMDRDLRRGGALVQQAAGKDSGTVPCHIEQSAEVRSRAAAHRMAGQQHEDDHHGGGLCGGIWLDLNALQRLSLHGS